MAQGAISGSLQAKNATINAVTSYSFDFVEWNDPDGEMVLEAGSSIEIEFPSDDYSSYFDSLPDEET